MAKLKEGDKAPAFSSVDQDGNKISLSDFKGKKLILFFYPQDDTPTCTIEACNLRDNYNLLKKKGFEIVGISFDDEKSHRKFIKKYSLPFTLIADSSRKIIEKYGLWVEKSMFGKTFMGTARTTFVIDEKGRITKRFDKVKSKEHAQQIAEELGE